MQHMIVIGKAHPFTVRAEYMHMATTAQRAGSKRRSNIHGIQVMGDAVFQHHAATMVEIILPACVRVFRAVDKHMLCFLRVYRHHADIRTPGRPVEHIHLPRLDINPLNGFTGK